MRHERKVHVLPANKVVELLQQIKDDQLYPLVIFAIGTGARLGECLALQWTDLSDDLTTVTFSFGMYKGERVELKSKSSRRTVRLPTFVRPALKRQQMLHSEWVFPNSRGGPA